MRCVDVNVLVYAHRLESPSHDELRDWLDRARRGPEVLAVPGVVASGFLRVVTHSRVFNEPTPVATARASLDALYRSPAVVPLDAGDRHWRLFTDLCSLTAATGNLVPDCYPAALALENGAAWVTTDRSFARYPGLRVEHPLD